MKNKNELSYRDLKITCNPNIFNFETTEELESLEPVLDKTEEFKLLNLVYKLM